MGLINIESILPSSKIDELSKKIMEIEAKWNEPKPMDPTLPQISGYSHSIDGSTHRIEKSPPYLNEEEKNFPPITFSEKEKKNRFEWFKDQIFNGVVKYLLLKYPEDFNRITEFEILDISESSNGLIENIIGQRKYDCLFLRKSWNNNDIHLFIPWRVRYKFLKDSTGNNDVKMSDLTIGTNKSGTARAGDTKEESKGDKLEEGEMVVSFSSEEYDKLTQSAAVDYIALLELSGKKLKCEIDKSYFTRTGIVLWKNNPELDVKVYSSSVSDKALEKSRAMTKNIQEDWKKTTENIKQEYLKTVKSVSGVYAQKRNEIKFMFEDFKTECKELSDISGEFAKRMAKLPTVSIVTTPAGPGVAVNAIITELDNLKATASSMTGIVSKIENLMNKLQLDKYAPLIPGIKNVHTTITNLLGLAKTAISLIK